MFVHKAHGIRTLVHGVHGDDYIFKGFGEDLDWVRAQMDSRFLIKVLGRLGGDADDLRELRVLNTVIRWAVAGIEMEADLRHAVKLREELSLDGDSKGLEGPIIMKSKEEITKEDPEVKYAAEVTKYRALAATAIFLLHKTEWTCNSVPRKSAGICPCLVRAAG